MTTASRWVLISMLMSSVAPSAFAYCALPPPKTCSLYFASDAVFVGKVLKYGHTKDYEYERYDLQVSRVLKGSVRRSTTVFTGNDTGRVIWRVGETYVVFASRVNGRLEARDGCGEQSDPNRAATYLREIAALKKSTSATIEGQVVNRSETTGIEGFSIRVVGASRHYSIKSDKRGYFNLRVPAGRYRILVDPRFVEPSDRQYVDRFDLVSGQCAQLEFREPEASRCEQPGTSLTKRPGT